MDILDGDVTALWKHPEGAPSNFQYNVQMAKYVQRHASVFFHKMFTVHEHDCILTSHNGIDGAGTLRTGPW